MGTDHGRVSIGQFIPEALFWALGILRIMHLEMVLFEFSSKVASGPGGLTDISLGLSKQKAGHSSPGPGLTLPFSCPQGRMSIHGGELGPFLFHIWVVRIS